MSMVLAWDVSGPVDGTRSASGNTSQPVCTHAEPESDLPVLLDSRLGVQGVVELEQGGEGLGGGLLVLLAVQEGVNVVGTSVGTGVLLLGLGLAQSLGAPCRHERHHAERLLNVGNLGEQSLAALLEVELHVAVLAGRCQWVRVLVRRGEV